MGRLRYAFAIFYHHLLAVRLMVWPVASYCGGNYTTEFTNEHQLFRCHRQTEWPVSRKTITQM